MRDRSVIEMFGLDGQVAVVTGALGRLGREYVRTLAAAGARVGAIDVAGDRSVFGSLAGVHVELADLSKKDETDRAIGEIVRALGAPSILVNNAGMGSSPATAGNENGPFEDYSEAAWDTMIDSHLKTTLFATQAFIRHFRAAHQLAESEETRSALAVALTARAKELPAGAERDSAVREARALIQASGHGLSGTEQELDALGGG